MDLLTAGSFRYGITRFSPIRIGPATRTGLLRIAAVVFDQPGGWGQQFKMRRAILSGEHQDGTGKEASNRILHEGHEAFLPFPT